jgi:DNA (cytosine-5)-methyltransferase 1
MTTRKGHKYVSLFTGAGGFDLGLESAGFWPSLCVEVDTDATRTIRANRPDWRLADPGDIHQLTVDGLREQANVARGECVLLVAGPPCQPFSKSSYWTTGDAPRLADPRSQTLRAFLEAVRVLLPQVLVLENVQGLAYRGKDEGLQLLKEGLLSINKRMRTSYRPQLLSINAADFGVPQLRQRVFLIASIDGSMLTPPSPTHGADAGLLPYLTAWDAIGALDGEQSPDALTVTGRWSSLLPSIPEGENYLWHTPRNQQRGGAPLFGWRTKFWSFLLKLAKNRPSWTIQAEPGPATGPFHWKNRLLSIDELCRLQTFPSNYTIQGLRRSAQRQIGNAVPPALGELLGLEIRRQLLGERTRTSLTLIPHRRDDCPAPERRRPVPREFLTLRGAHRDHPGTGHGPAARRRTQASIAS